MCSGVYLCIVNTVVIQTPRHNLECGYDSYRITLHACRNLSMASPSDFHIVPGALHSTKASHPIIGLFCVVVDLNLLFLPQV